MGGQILSELHDAVRSLRRSPGFAAVVALTLGVGVGSAGAVFAMANQLLLRPTPGVSDPGGAAYLDLSTPERGAAGLSSPDIDELRRSATLLDGLAAYDNVRQHVSVAGARPVEVDGVTVQGDYFELLGVRPAAGRLLTASETGAEADPFVAVISEELWARLFGRAPDVAGRQIQMRGHSFTVLGVADDFTGTDSSWTVHVWLPRTAFAPLENYPAERLWSRASRLNQWFVVRPRAGVELAAAEEELNSVLARLAAEDAENRGYLESLQANLYPGLLPPDLEGRIRATLAVLGGSVALLLLITCANVANLLLVRAARREGDSAVRSALGASRARLARRHLLESLLLGCAGTLVGLAVAWLISLWFVDVAIWGLPGFEGFRLDGRIVAFAAASILATTVLPGALPAILAVRAAPGPLLRASDTHATRRHGPLRHGSSALQIALSLTLLIGSVLLGRTVMNLYAVDAGVALDGVSALTLAMERDRPEGAEMDQRHRAVLEAVRAVEGVRSAALHSWYGPYAEGLLTMRVARTDSAEIAADGGAVWVTPDWFELLGVPLLAGRLFQESDWAPVTPSPVVVSAALARRLFGHSNVVGRLVQLGRANSPFEAEIVGVVSDVRLVDVRREPDDALFLAHTTQPALLNPLTILFRAAPGDLQVSRDVQSAVEAALPNLPVPAAAPLEDRIDTLLVEQRVFVKLLGLLSALAVLVSMVGLYAVVAFSTGGRKREFAVRLALGADGKRIAALVFRPAAATVAVGTALGLAGAYALSRVLESRLFGVGALDGASYLGASLLLAAVAALACWAPARSAAGTDPASTLRGE